MEAVDGIFEDEYDSREAYEEALLRRKVRDELVKRVALVESIENDLFVSGGALKDILAVVREVERKTGMKYR